MAWILLPLGIMLAFYCWLVLPRSTALTAETIFVYMQFVMAVGTLPLLDPARASDRVHATIIVYALVAFMVTSGLLTVARQPRTRPTLQLLRPAPYVPSLAFWFLLLIAISISVAYYAAVGYSAFIRGLVDAFTGADSDIAGLRLDSYSGERYLYPGYVNQFKNVLLPALTLLAITYWAIRKKRRLLVSVSLIVISIFCLIGTGQRGAFVVFIAVAFVYFVLINRGKIPRRVIVLGVGVFFAIFVVTTFALGRESIQSSTSVLGSVAAALDQFVLRIFTANQSSGVIGFRYIYSLGPLYDGSEWVKAIMGLLPGEARGSSLANEIFAIRYGSDRGTSPPSMWGSVYYNFGPVGVALMPVILAAVYNRVVSAAFHSADRSSLELMGIAGVFVILGFWISGSPLFLLNEGLAIYIALWLCGANIRMRSSRFNTQAVSVGPAARMGDT